MLSKIDIDELMENPEKLLIHIADLIDRGEVDQWSSDMLREMAHDFKIKKYKIASPNTFEISEDNLHRLEQLGAYEDGETESYDIGSKVRGTDKYNYWE
jgi:hypothetical protein